MGKTFSKQKDPFQISTAPPARGSFLGQPTTPSNRNSYSNNNNGGNSSSNRRRSSIQNALNMLPRPGSRRNSATNNTPIYSPVYVGAKAHNIQKLQRTGVNLPAFVIISASESSRAFDLAAKATGITIERWILDPEIEFDAFRDSVASTALDSVALEEIAAFMTPGKTYAVRSSANLEDGYDSAYAGHFRTVLNIPARTPEICSAVRQCWLSAIDETMRPIYRKNISAGQAPTIQMAVIIMEQIDSEASGVFFQANPTSGSQDTFVINASFGQGEGVVGGKIPIDEFWIDSKPPYTEKRRVIGTKTHKVTLQAQGGLVTVDVPPIEQKVPSLTQGMIKDLISASEKIRTAFAVPMDIEFAFSNNTLYILQARPITTRALKYKWEAPDVGLWRLNPHFAHPVSAIYGPVWVEKWSVACMTCSDLIGCGFTAMDSALINGLPYFCPRIPGPKAPPKSLPPKFLMKMILWFNSQKAMKQAEKFWKEKTYLKDLEYWDITLKPELITKHRALIAVDMKNLNTTALIDHLRNCHAHFAECLSLHISWSPQAIAVAGWFMYCTHEWSKKQVSVEDASLLLGGSCRIIHGFYWEWPAVFEFLVEQSSSDLLSKLSAEYKSISNLTDGKIQEGIELIRKEIPQAVADLESRLAQGYDVCETVVKECPKLLLSCLLEAIETAKRVKADPDYEKTFSKEAFAKAEEIRSKISTNKQSEWDTLYLEARKLWKLRDERPIYTDLWASGILHLALLEAGERIQKANPTLSNPVLILDASLDEVINVLQNPTRPTNETLFLDEWPRRLNHRKNLCARDAPHFIGGKLLELTFEHFPNTYMGMSYTGTMVAVKLIDTPMSMEARFVDAGHTKGTFFGVNASRGIVCGRAIVVLKADDTANIRKGDIAILEFPSSVVNLVIACGVKAIVCDYGGSLSHAAICAREAGIPCVVGVTNATSTIRDGQEIEVDGNEGIVRVIL